MARLRRHRISACTLCKPLLLTFQRAITSLKRENTRLLKDITNLTKENIILANKLHLNPTVNKITIRNPGDIHPDDLRMSNFEDYLGEMEDEHPQLKQALSAWMSQTHKSKHNNANTGTKWVFWSNFYRSWIADVLCRARASKVVRRTNLFLSAYLLVTRVPTPAWRFLQRLRLVVSKEVIEKWIRSHSRKEISKDTFLIHIIDNLDIRQHVTRVRTGHRSEMMHLLSR